MIHLNLVNIHGYNKKNTLSCCHLPGPRVPDSVMPNSVSLGLGNPGISFLSSQSGRMPRWKYITSHPTFHLQ
jgi:hypothetical protein